jgi:hypothetical protein
MEIWTSEKAHAWYETVKWQVGLNFVPSNAINPTDMWQEETYDEETIRREVSFASSVGYNSMRVFLPFIVWESEGEAFLRRFDRFLSIAAENGMTVMPVIFDDCEFDRGRDPYLGKQADPIPGVLNGRWTACPGFTIADDPTRVADLRAYVHAVVGRYREDPRILVWDMYNEPGNFSRTYKALPLLANAFSWARECEPTQPLTAGAWLWNNREAWTRAMVELSDVVSFHTYVSLESTKKFVEFLSLQNKPLFCTEWLNRSDSTNTFFNHLPYFAENKISCWSWGCVAGKTLTYVNKRDPAVWQQDVFHADGTPFDPAEFVLLRQLKGERASVGSNPF